MADLLSVQEAKAQILTNFAPVSTVNVSLADCANRILAENIVSEVDLPPFANSSMDGYAVIAADLRFASAENPVALQIIEEIAAGSMPQTTIHPGQAARIMTGAPLPPGADSVIPIEETRLAQGSGSNQIVYALKIIHPGEYIRPKGQDIQPGQLILERGRKLQPQDVGMLASLGYLSVPVYRKPRLAIFSTGNEICPPGIPLQPGQIYDSNTFTLAALAEKAGAEVFRLGIGPDNLAEIRHFFDQALAKNVDIILTSAGVSVGSFDYVRKLIETEGKIMIWRVNMRPGKPVTFGTYQNTPVIGLPGNPVSAFVGFEVFVRPVLDRLAGLPGESRQPVRALLAEDVESDGRETYLRGILTREGGKIMARLAGHQGSGNLFSLVQANALLIVPSGVKSLRIGAEISAWLLVD